MIRQIAAVAAVALATTACPAEEAPEAPPAEEPPPAEPPPDPPAEPDPMVRTAACTNAEDGYRVEHPADWQTNPGTVVSECRLFDPEPIELEPHTEIPSDIAISIQREPVPFEDVTGEPRGERELTRQELAADGRRAVCQDIELVEDLLRPAGSRSYRCSVDLNGETLIVVTHEEGEPDFETTKRVLDAMIRTLELTGQNAGGNG